MAADKSIHFLGAGYASIESFERIGKARVFGVEIEDGKAVRPTTDRGATTGSQHIAGG